MNTMKTVTVSFVVKSKAEANALMDEISENIGNNFGVPFIRSTISPSTDDEVQAFKEVTE
jgi:hypothetical protein